MKICGVRDPENIEALCGLEPDYLGFDFRPWSVNYLGEIDEALLSVIAERVFKVGIFEGAESLYISYIAGRFSLSGVQIEGDVSPQALELLVAEGLEVIKVVDDISQVAKYEGVCHKFLVRDSSVLGLYRSSTPLIVDSGVWSEGCGASIVDFAESSVIKNVERIEDWIKDNI